ncbi:MAG: hypothetical protein ABR923_06915 [Terracidiphilus sp.]|jgi:hypothetical protein
MQETLEGRLEWEKSARGIAVKIPARRGSAFALFGPAIGIWMIVVSMHSAFASGANTPDDRSNALLTLIGGIGVSVILVLAWLAWALTSDTVMTLDENQFKIERRVLGIELSTLSFATADLHDINYVPPANFLFNKQKKDIRTSKIEFQANEKRLAFAEGVTREEAQALLTQMGEFCKFPAEYIPVSGSFVALCAAGADVSTGDQLN